MLGTQRASRTDIGDKRLFDRIPGLRSLATIARRIRRAALGKPEAMKDSDVRFGRPDS